MDIFDELVIGCLKVGHWRLGFGAVKADTNEIQKGQLIFLFFTNNFMTGLEGRSAIAVMLTGP